MARERRRYRLTKRTVEAFTTQRPDGEIFYDDKVSRFGLKVFPSGRRSYVLDYVAHGKRRRIVLGEHGVLTVDQARAMARSHQAEIAKGGDPLADKQAQRKEHTFEAWVEAYLELTEKEGRHTPRWHIEVARHLGHAAEMFGGKRLSEVTARDVERFRDEEAVRGKITCNRALGTLKACLAEAWRRDLVPSNQASKVRRIGAESPRQRVLTDTELSALAKAIDDCTDPVFRVAMLWLLTTGCRQSEARRALWAHLDLADTSNATWHLPQPKNRRPITKPLPPELARALAALPRTSAFVLGRYGELGPSVFNKEWRALRDEAGLSDDVHCHDIRRTYGLHAARASGLHVAAKLLGHASVRTTEAVYSPLQLEDLRKGQEAVAEARAKILPFRQKESK
jgi:integrase